MPEKTPIEKVYDQLSSAPIQHPASARLFADWRLQAGDVVTVTSGNESYQVPVYNMEMTWKGSPMVEVDATGSKERPPLPALARRSYGGSRAQAQMEDDLDGISSQLVQQNDKIGLVVTETSGGNVIRAASIMAAINDDTSSVKLKADHIELVGSTIKISDVISIQNGLSIINASGVSATFMDAETLQLRSGGSGSALNTVNPNSVSDVQVVPNGSSGYKLQKKTWGSPNTWTDAGTFSSAATVAGTWGSGVFTVSATSGTANTVTTSLTNTGHWGSASNEGEVLTTYYYETKATIGTSGTLYNTGNKTQISAASKLTTASGTPSFVRTVDVEPTGTYFGLTKVTIAKATISATREANKPTGTEIAQTFTQNGYYKAGTDGCVYVNVPIPTVTLDDPTWEKSGSNITYNNRYTVLASNGAYKDQMLYLTTSGLTVSLRTDSEGGTVRAKVTCKDNDLVAGNIKSGVNIFGVTGTYTGKTYAHQMSLTRQKAGTGSGVYNGYLYRKESDGSYSQMGSSGSYWYSSGTNTGGNVTVYYD